MIKFSSVHSNIIYSCGFDENLHMIDIGTKQIKKTYSLMFPITCFEVLKNEESMVIGGYYGDLILYSIKEGVIL